MYNFGNLYFMFKLFYHMLIVQEYIFEFIIDDLFLLTNVTFEMYYYYITVSTKLSFLFIYISLSNISFLLFSSRMSEDVYMTLF